jgi:NADP-dependent 3-hydroxy acid dehydrogenase YdfG
VADVDPEMTMDRPILIAGAAGQVGEGIAGALLARGRSILALSRSQTSLDALRERLGDMDRERAGFVALDLSRHEAPQLIRAAAPAGLGSAVVALGGWQTGGSARVADWSLWESIRQDSLDAHLHAARTILPLLDGVPGATYMMINGGAALRPMAGAALMSVAAAAQVMLARGLAVEQPPGGAVVLSLVLNTPIRTRERTGPPVWLSAEEVGAAVAGLLSSPNGSRCVLLNRGRKGEVQATSV